MQGNGWWSVGSLILQYIAIISASAFGAWGVLAKGKFKSLKAADKVALIGLVAAGFVGTAVLTVTAVSSHIDERHQREEKFTELKESIGREDRLLQEIERQEYQITDFGFEIEYSISAQNPRLTPLIASWEKYIADLDPRLTPDDDAYDSGPDWHVSLYRTQGGVDGMRIEAGSKLFPDDSSGEWNALFMNVQVLVLRPGAPPSATKPNLVGSVDSNSPYVEMAFLFPLIGMDRESAHDKADEKPKVHGWLVYNRAAKMVSVHAKLASARPLRDRGAIIGLHDLPGHIVAMAGLRQKNVVSVTSMSFDAKLSGVRPHGGRADIAAGDLTVLSRDGRLAVEHTFKASDFKVLATPERSASFEDNGHAANHR